MGTVAAGVTWGLWRRRCKCVHYRRVLGLYLLLFYRPGVCPSSSLPRTLRMSRFYRQEQWVFSPAPTDDTRCLRVGSTHPHPVFPFYSSKAVLRSPPNHSNAFWEFVNMLLITSTAIFAVLFVCDAVPTPTNKGKVLLFIFLFSLSVLDTWPDLECLVKTNVDF